MFGLPRVISYIWNNLIQIIMRPSFHISFSVLAFFVSLLIAPSGFAQEAITLDRRNYIALSPQASSLHDAVHYAVEGNKSAAPNVGFGWVLDVGGNINRVIKGKLKDEKKVLSWEDLFPRQNTK